ncbi:Uncharacterised protein [Acinetobacter baumannii]|nr:Uncharacterised protein [Acinetobacter baumannii]
MINTTYKLISKLNLKNATYGQYFEKEQIDTERLKVMYSIYEQYYENTRFSIFVDVIYAELSGDFPLGDSRQPTYKSLRPFDLVS